MKLDNFPASFEQLQVDFGGNFGYFDGRFNQFQMISIKFEFIYVIGTFSRPILTQIERKLEETTSTHWPILGTIEWKFVGDFLRPSLPPCLPSSSPR